MRDMLRNTMDDALLVQYTRTGGNEKPALPKAFQRSIHSKLFVLISQSFEVGIANTISRFK